MDMSMPMSTPMPASSMQMTFFQSTTTPLYSLSWTPSTQAGYAGTCIFLLLLALLFRALLGGQHLLEQRWLDRELNRRYVVVQGKPTEAESIDSDAQAKSGTLVTEMGVEERVKVVRRASRGVVPWRVSVDVPRAAYGTVVAGIGYLL